MHVSYMWHLHFLSDMLCINFVFAKEEKKTIHLLSLCYIIHFLFEMSVYSHRRKVTSSWSHFSFLFWTYMRLQFFAAIVYLSLILNTTECAHRIKKLYYIQVLY